MRWIFPEEISIPSSFNELVGGHPLVAERLWRTGIRSAEKVNQFLDPQYYHPASPFEFPGMQQAVGIAKDAISSRSPILVWGDFDVDGQTATSLLVSALSQCGANVNYHIPVREQESHGIKRSVLDRFIDSGISLLVTCDTGITAHEAINYAHSHGIKVIITDHHKLGVSLPSADAIINPNMLPMDHQLSTLPGVGVAFKFIEALTEHASFDINIDQFLDLVALGIVADVSSLKFDTRYLLQKGLPILRKAQRVGLRLIYEKAGLEMTGISPEVIGFQIAPRLNAIGRLGDANPIVDLLLTDDEGRADVIATQVEGMNHLRQLLVKQVLDSALKLVEENPDVRRSPVIILYRPDWPSGIIGIVASHLAEKYHKPAILMTGSDGTVRGSARSIDGVDITAAIGSQSPFLHGFGGHPMAGGLSMPLENLPAFTLGLQTNVNEQLVGLDLTPGLEIASILELSELSIPLVQDIERLSPFGNGNPPLTFVTRDLHITSDRKVGREMEHRQISISDDQGLVQKVIWWNGGSESLPEGKFDLAYNLSSNTYRGQQEVSLVWVDVSQEQTLIEIQPSISILDHRQSLSPFSELQAIMGTIPSAQVWAETTSPLPIKTVDRRHLEPGETLILWSIPPSNSVLQQLLKSAQPEVIHVFASPSDPPTLQEMLKVVAGMVKFAISHESGSFLPSHLAASTAMTSEWVLSALSWLQEKGLFTFEFSQNDLVYAKGGDGKERSALKQASMDLEKLWSEFLAFQSFYRTANLSRIFP
jgi:single-stranded-DNA-specific exonuclease